MPQFNPTSLARVMAEVRRETLVEAAEIAELTQFFDTFERTTIVEVGQLFNLLSNFAALGPENVLLELKERRIQEGDELSTGASAVADFMIATAINWFELFAKIAGVEEVLKEINELLLVEEEEPPSDVPIDIPESVFFDLEQARAKLSQLLLVPLPNTNTSRLVINLASDSRVLVSRALAALPR